MYFIHPVDYCKAIKITEIVLNVSTCTHKIQWWLWGTSCKIIYTTWNHIFTFYDHTHVVEYKNISWNEKYLGMEIKKFGGEGNIAKSVKNILNISICLSLEVGVSIHCLNCFMYSSVHLNLLRIFNHKAKKIMLTEW